MEFNELAKIRLMNTMLLSLSEPYNADRFVIQLDLSGNRCNCQYLTFEE